MARRTVTITLFNAEAEALLAHCAAFDDQPSLVVRDALKLLYDELGPRIAEDDVDLVMEADLAIVKGEMGLPQ